VYAGGDAIPRGDAIPHGNEILLLTIHIKGIHKEESRGVICSSHSLHDCSLSACLVDRQGVNMGQNLDSNRNPDARSILRLCTACTGRGSHARGPHKGEVFCPSYTALRTNVIQYRQYYKTTSPQMISCTMMLVCESSMLVCTTPHQSCITPTGRCGMTEQG